jgi:hypothetical protein
MPATNPDGAHSSARKRTLSNKAATNGDPHVERKRRKLDEVPKKRTKTALTKKKPTTLASQKNTKNSKVAKTAPESPSVLVEGTSDNENTDEEMFDPPPSPEIIAIDDEDNVEVPEAPEESAEAELRMFFLFS